MTVRAKGNLHMKYATQTDGKSSRRKMHTGFLPVISAVILCVAGICLMRRRNMGTVGEERVMQREELAVQKEASLKEKEKEYIEFEKLFRENEDDLQKFIEMSQDIWKEGKYIILFDESEYLRSGMQSAYRQEGLTVILYDNDIITVVENEKAEEILNGNYDLIKVLNSIKENGAVLNISKTESSELIQEIFFMVDTEFTPFIENKNGVENAFVWCNSEECEKYGYKNVEGNWYMWISSAPE